MAAPVVPSVPATTKAQWVTAATPWLAVLARGDSASQVAMQQLLVDALAIVQTAP
jgi:hypothetical protein